MRGLLFTIARRVAIDLYRRPPSSRAFAQEVEDAEAFDARADEVLLAVTVRDAMMSLSPAHREVLELIYDEDLKLGEIACKLDVPLGTVKTRAFYALRAMRAALRERGFNGRAPSRPRKLGGSPELDADEAHALEAHLLACDRLPQRGGRARAACTRCSGSAAPPFEVPPDLEAARPGAP